MAPLRDLRHMLDALRRDGWIDLNRVRPGEVFWGVPLGANGFSDGYTVPQDEDPEAYVLRLVSTYPLGQPGQRGVRVWATRVRDGSTLWLDTQQYLLHHSEVQLWDRMVKLARCGIHDLVEMISSFQEELMAAQDRAGED